MPVCSPRFLNRRPGNDDQGQEQGGRDDPKATVANLPARVPYLRDGCDHLIVSLSPVVRASCYNAWNGMRGSHRFVIFDDRSDFR